MDISDVIGLIQSDQGLPSSKKEELLKEDNKKKLERTLSGAAGAALGLALSKYKKMSPATQLLLSALGFGAGVLVYDYYNREKFSNYNDKTKMYEINSK